MLAPSLKNVCEMAGPAVCHDWWVCHTPGLKSTEVRRETFEQFISSIKTYVGHGRERKQRADAHTQTARRHSTPHATALRFPPAHLPVATEFAPPSLTMVPRVRTYQVGERMLAITADSRRTSQEAMV